MRILQVAIDDGTYEALEEMAGRDLRPPSTFILMLVRKELGLPYPYEESPLRDDPALYRVPTAERYRKWQRTQKHKQSNNETPSSPVASNNETPSSPVASNGDSAESSKGRRHRSRESAPASTDTQGEADE